MKIIYLILLLLITVPTYAVELNQPVTAQDKQTFDSILEPLIKIYNFVKYAATFIAVLFLLFAGILFLISGSDRRKRETAKDMGTYIVIGLIIIWVAPLLVQYLTS